MGLCPVNAIQEQWNTPGLSHSYGRAPSAVLKNIGPRIAFEANACIYSITRTHVISVGAAVKAVGRLLIGLQAPQSRWHNTSSLSRGLKVTSSETWTSAKCWAAAIVLKCVHRHCIALKGLQQRGVAIRAYKCPEAYEKHSNAFFFFNFNFKMVQTSLLESYYTFWWVPPTLYTLESLKSLAAMCLIL